MAPGENAGSLPLTPFLDEAIARFVRAVPNQLPGLVREFGSPLNIVWPHCLQQNVSTFRSVLTVHKLRFEIFYGAKVNKSQALVRAAAHAGIGVDVSSLYELRDALRAGVPATKLCATGPAKTAPFHLALIENGCLISIDSVEEFAALENVVRTASPVCKPRVLLRYRPVGSAASRFGMSGDDLMQSLQRLAEPASLFSFEGFHFHLGGYAFETRVNAMREICRYVDTARHLGLTVRMIDIGGGLPIRYVDSDAYAAFLQSQCEAHYRSGEVPESFYPYGSEIDAGSWLDRLLLSDCVDGLSIANYLNHNDITLGLEPGRSLVDQAAISVFRITCVKALDGHKHVVFVEGSSFSACETWFRSEFLVDPILVPGESSDQPDGAPVQAYIAGHSCLDDDVITNRLIAFHRMPIAGDLLVFANTAGYQMDLLENEFHRHPMPRRIAVVCNADGGQDISPDN